MINSIRISSFLCLLLLCGCTNDNQTDQDTPESTEPTPDLITPADAAVPLTAFSFTDSVLLLPEYSLSPQALVDIKTVIPHAADEGLNLKINKDLASMMVGEEMPIKVDNLAQTLQSAVAMKLYNYRKHDVDSTEVGEMPHAYSLSLSHETEVLVNDHSLLSLSTSNYSYSGGAHGNYYTELRTYSTITNAVLTPQDLFPPEVMSELNGLLKSRVDPDRLYGPEDPVEATQNFALTKEGILFIYPPYELGPYAAGEIEVLLKYADIEQLLTPEARQLIAPLKPQG